MIDRNKVLWLGGPPSPSDFQEHANRGLLVCEVGSAALMHDAMDLTLARGLVLNAVPPHVPRIVQALGCVAAAVNVRKRYLGAAAALGFQWEPAAIWEGFLNLPTRRWPRAPIHGDLHAENVRVRGDDAIIIDLARATMGPPSADPACLEVWIAFELPPTDVQVDEAGWLSVVQGLYASPMVCKPTDPCVSGTLSWLGDSILQIRRLAQAKSSPTDYAITLALYLMRRAMFEPDPQSPEIDMKRRTWAWILGCQLFEAVRAMESCYEEAA